MWADPRGKRGKPVAQACQGPAAQFQLHNPHKCNERILGDMERKYQLYSAHESAGRTQGTVARSQLADTLLCDLFAPMRLPILLALCAVAFAGSKNHVLTSDKIIQSISDTIQQHAEKYQAPIIAPGPQTGLLVPTRQQLLLS